MRLFFKELFFIVAACFDLALAYKILIFSPGYGRSHVAFMGNIADELVQAGHNVTVLIQQVDRSINTNGTKLAKVILLDADPRAAEFFDTVMKKELLANAWESNIDMSSMLSKTKLMTESFVATCEQTIAQKNILDELRNEKFDLAIAEVMDGCSMGLIEVLQIPAFIAACSTSLADSVAPFFGVPLFPSYVPNLFSKSMDEMSYAERAINFISTIAGNYLSDQFIYAEDEVFKKFYGGNFIKLHKKIPQASFLFTNMEPLFDFPRPITHKVIEIGGLGIPPVKLLNAYWEEVMTKRDKVIVMSFGTMAQSQFMPQLIKTTILETFALFPDVTFIWKYEADDLQSPKDLKNVVFNKWLPQNDLLYHENLVAFITHGGMNSIIETVFAGKPMIVIPVFADQNRNANLVKKAGIGLTLKVEDLKVMGKLHQAISCILNDNGFSKSARKMAKMIANKPVSAKAQMLRYVEFAAEFGPLPNLDPVGRTMPFRSYFLLDIIIPTIAFVLLLIALTLFVIYRLILRLVRKAQKIKTT